MLRYLFKAGASRKNGQSRNHDKKSKLASMAIKRFGEAKGIAVPSYRTYLALLLFFVLFCCLVLSQVYMYHISFLVLYSMLFVPTCIIT